MIARALLACLLGVLVAGARAAPIEPLQINRTVSMANYGPIYTPAPLAGGYVLTLCAAKFDCELWFADGTPNGVRMIKDLSQFNSSTPSQFAAMGGHVYFFATNFDTSPWTGGLWRTDGTADGTVLVKNMGVNGDVPPTVVGSKVLFVENSGRLWSTDGTPAGTTMLMENFIWEPRSLVSTGSTAYFAANDGITGMGIWRTDGTPGGTYLVKNVTPVQTGQGPYEWLHALGDRIVFWAAGTGPQPPSLWVSDGTAAGTSVLMTSIEASARRSIFATVGGKAFFIEQAFSSTLGLLWSTDGTAAGTSVVRSWNGSAPPFERLGPYKLAVAGPYVYFTVADDNPGAALWRSDGTPGGTQSVFRPADGTAPERLVAAGASLYFFTQANVTGSFPKVWKTDGVPGSTVQLSVPDTYLPGMPLGSKLLLNDWNGSGAAWITDGTPAGTVPLISPADQPSAGSSCRQESTLLGGSLFFSASDGIHGCEPWKSDGIGGATAMVSDVFPGIFSSITSGPELLPTASGGKVYFVANTNDASAVLWQTDGTAAGTRIVKPVGASRAGSGVDAVVDSGGIAYFTAWDQYFSSINLWRTDGTEAGTYVVKSIPTTTAYPFHLAAAGGKVYMWVNDPGNLGTTLWATNGTAAGTIELGRFNGVSHAVAMGSQLFFAGNLFESGNELWKSDGTVAGTSLVYDIMPGHADGLDSILGVLGNSLILAAGGGVWRSDGTPGGTYRISTTRPVATYWSGTGAAVMDGSLYFVAYASPRSELHRTDGTQAGTRRVAQLPEGGHFNSGKLYAAGGTLFFTYDDHVHGNELWMSTGTPEGTVLVQDFAPGLAGLPGSPQYFGDTQSLDIATIPNGLFILSTYAEEPLFMRFVRTPDALAFAPKSVPTNSIAVSDPVQVTGINVAVTATATGGDFCVSSGAQCSCDVRPYAQSGAVNFGQYLCVRHPAAASPNTSVTTAMNVGGVAASFTSTTPATSPPTFAFEQVEYSVNEDGPGITVRVRRDGSSTGAVGVTWSTANGTAIAGTDFGTAGNAAQRSGVLTWSSGDMSPKTISIGGRNGIPILDNGLQQAARTFSLALSATTGGAVVGETGVAAITILDDESVFQFETALYIEVGEKGPNVAARIIRTGSIEKAQTVNWSASNGSAIAGQDYGSGSVPPSGSIVFAPGVSTQAIQIGPVPVTGPYIPIIDDALIEGPETFTIALSVPPGSARIGLMGTAAVRINSDEGGIAMGSASFSVEERFTAYVPVRRIGPLSDGVSVTYATFNGTAIAGRDYVGTSGTIGWGINDGDTKFIPVGIVNDAVVNGTRTFDVRLTSVTGHTGPVGAVLGQPSSTVVTIIDDDSTVQFSTATVSVSEGAASVLLTVTRTGGPAGSLIATAFTFDGTAIRGTDYGVAGQTNQQGPLMAWGPDDMSSRTILIPIINDTVPEGAKTFTMTLQGPVGPIPTVTVTINDDDAATMFAQPAYTVDETAGSVTLAVNRVGLANVPASVTWTAANGTAIAGQDFGSSRSGSAAPKGVLAWQPGDTSPKTITIPIINDTIADVADETFTVVLSAPSSGLTLASPSTATVTIVDDEIAPETEIAFATPKVVITEGDTVGGTLVMTRTPLPGKDCSRAATVNWGTVAGTATAFSDFDLNAGTFQWTAGDCTPKPLIGIKARNDSTIEPPEIFTILLASPSPGAKLGAAQSAVVLVLDDDELFPPPVFALDARWSKPAAANGAWAIEHDTPYEGSRTLRSNAIGDNESAQVELATNVTAAGNIAFRVRISSEEGFDFLRFYVDGVKKGEWSGTTNTTWQSFTTPITAGAHVLRWSYEKDGTASMGADAAWIDALTLPAGTPIF